MFLVGVDADSGYRGVRKRQEVKDTHPDINWQVAMMPSHRTETGQEQPRSRALPNPGSKGPRAPAANQPLRETPRKRLALDDSCLSAASQNSGVSRRSGPVLIRSPQDQDDGPRGVCFWGTGSGSAAP